MRDRYLCIKIDDAHVFDDVADGADVKVWIDVHWAGVVKTTRQFKKEIVN